MRRGSSRGNRYRSLVPAYRSQHEQDRPPQLAQHAYPFLELHQRDHEGHRATRNFRRVMHHEAEHRAATAGDDVVDRHRFVLPHRRHRWVPQAAIGKPLDPQFVGLDSIPENAVSRDDEGRIIASGSKSSGTELGEPAGLNLRMRQFISATSSSPTCHTMCWLMNQPSPSAVCLGPTTSPSSALMLTCSPGNR